jgi:uncharacterized damage-inducible protein DinB
MTRSNEMDTFRKVWNAEAAKTIEVMESLPGDQYDFRPDAEGRSIGELAWHLSEVDACVSFGIAAGRFRIEDEPPHLKRPREISQLAPGYRQVHEEAVARLDGMTDMALDQKVSYFDGRELTIGQILWNELIHHMVHHRGQLVLLCRQAGGTPPGLFGPNREQMRAMQAGASAATA